MNNREAEEFFENKDITIKSLYRVLSPLDKIERFVLIGYLKRHSKCPTISIRIEEALKELRKTEEMQRSIVDHVERREDETT